ncbi:signal peptide peptidase SppA [Vulgatibacter sp.]|uniref:signal peptide peptidase SppA n=1 Tax=Vulgatibacter sp. TaxID=1971226 RepID=UPI00356399D4
MHRLLSSACALVLAASPLAAAAQITAELARAPTDGLEQPAASGAITEGPAAAVVNPAAIGLQSFSLRYLHQEGVDGGNYASGNGDGLYLGGKLVGPLGGTFAVEWLRHQPGIGDYRRTTWALSLGGETLALGAALRLFSADLDALEDVVSVDVGAIARPERWLSVGFTVADVDASDFGGTRLPRRYIGSVGLRPVGDWLTLAVDGVVLGAEAPGDENGFDAMRLGYTARAEVLRGVSLIGALSHRVDGEGPVAAQLGLALDFDHLGLEATPILQSGEGDPGFLVAAEVSKASRQGIGLKRKGRMAVVDLDSAMRTATGLQLFPSRQRDAMVDAIEGLHRLAGDDGVEGLVVKLRSLPEVGQGEAFELRQALLDFRASGKPVVALLSGGDDTEYYVASAADRIYATPESALFVNGFATRVNFYADTLSLLGVDVEAVKVGAYKNAPDQLTRNDISDEQIEVIDSLLDDLFGRYVAAVTGSRKIDEAAFRAALETGIQSGRLAKELGLVDDLVYPDELEEELEDWLGRRVTLADKALRPEAWDSWGAAPIVAIVPIEGTITGGRSGGDFGFVETTGAQTVVDAIESASSDPRVHAIVLRIDSGGGDAAGSERIWRAIVKARDRKPIVASMGDAAASGGYFAAVGTKRIFAAPGTITGSIGIFWLKPSFEGLLDFVEVKSYRSLRGDLADIGSLQDDWSEAERAAMERYVEDAYRGFVEAVAEGRSLPVEAVDAVARGRVWTGAQAYERKLVDELGGLSQALRYAREQGGLGAETAVEYRVYRPGAALLSLGPGFALTLETPQLELPDPVAALVRDRLPPALLLPNERGLWALAPFEIEVR